MKILFSLLAFCLFASCVHSQEALDTVNLPYCVQCGKWIEYYLVLDLRINLCEIEVSNLEPFRVFVVPLLPKWSGW